MAMPVMPTIAQYTKTVKTEAPAWSKVYQSLDKAPLSVGDTLEVRWATPQGKAYSELLWGLVALRKVPDAAQRVSDMDVRITLDVTAKKNREYGNFKASDSYDSLMVMTLEVGHRNSGDTISGLSAALAGKEEAMAITKNTHRLSCTIHSIEVNTGNGYMVVKDLPQGLEMDLSIEWRSFPEFDLDPPAMQQATIHGCDAMNGVDAATQDAIETQEAELAWAPVTGATEYNVEWTWVDDYRHNDTGTGLGASSLSYDLDHNSTRVSTSANSYRLPLVFDRGWVVYRVRAMGQDVITGMPIYGPWTLTAGTGNVGAVPSSRIPITVAHNPRKNWQLTTSYAEEGKHKEVMVYADGTSRERQSVTRNSSLNVPIIKETFYDAVGRAAVQVMPVPMIKDKKCETFGDGSPWAPIDYYSDFNQASNGGVHPFRFTDLLATGDGCGSAAAKLDAGDGAELYYNPNSLLISPHLFETSKFLPQAEGYPYAQTEYVRDNTGRVAKAGGVGPLYQLGTGGHPTHYLYGNPEQIELDRLFGSEAPYASQCQKNIVIDANGQASATYLDGSGHTIATSLIGSATANLADLPSATTGVRLESDLFGGQPSTDCDLNHLDPVAGTMTFSKVIVVAEDNADYDLHYDLTIPPIEDGCLDTLVCFHCVYDLDLKVTNAECGEVVYHHSDIVGRFNTANGEVYFDPVGSEACGQDPPVAWDVDGVSSPSSEWQMAHLNTGTYIVSKTLSVHGPAREQYATAYASGDYLRDNCFASLDEITDSVMATVDTTDCSITCDECVSALGSLEDFVGDGGTADQWHQLYADCMAPCTEESWCSIAYGNMLSDMRPGGQYAKYTLDDPDPVIVDDATSIFRAHDQYCSLRARLRNSGSTTALDYYDPGRPLWQQPRIYFDDGTSADEFLDDTGVRTKVWLSTEDGGPPYYPEVVDNDSVFQEDGNSYTYPENLNKVRDFIALFQNGWERSLVRFHPEYGYYVDCKKYGEKQDPAQGLTSDEFDAKLRHTSRVDAWNDDGLAFVYSGATTSIADRTSLVGSGFVIPTPPSPPYLPPYGPDIAPPSGWQPMDPFVQYEWNDGGSELKDSYLNYFHVPNTTIVYSMPEFVAILTRCGGAFGGVSAYCKDFEGTATDDILDNEWDMLKSLYLAKKYEIQKRHADASLDACNGTLRGVNQCIGEGDEIQWKQVLERLPMYPSGTYSSSAPYYSSCQPCNQANYAGFADKVRRVAEPSPPAGATDPNTSAALVYQQTGQCPLALAWSSVFTQLATSHQLYNVSNVDLYDLTSYASVLLAQNNYQPTPPTGHAYWNSILDPATGIITANIDFSAPDPDCSEITLTPPAGSDLDSVLQVLQLVALNDQGFFTLTVAAMENGQVVAVPVAGHMCTGLGGFDLYNCSFPSICNANAMGEALQDMLNQFAGLYSSDWFSSSLTVPNLPTRFYDYFDCTYFGSTIPGPLVQLALSNGTLPSVGSFTLRDTRAYASAPTLHARRLRFDIDSVLSPSGANLLVGTNIQTVLNNVQTFTNIRSQGDNSFAVDLIDLSGLPMGTMKGEAYSIGDYVSTDHPEALGTCNEPPLPACADAAHMLLPDLISLMQDRLGLLAGQNMGTWQDNMDLFASPYMNTNLASVLGPLACPTCFDEDPPQPYHTESTLSHTGTVYTITIPMSHCDMAVVLTFTSGNSFASVDAFSVWATSPPDDGVYHEIKANLKNSSGTVIGYVTVTSECLSLIACEPCAGAVSAVPPPTDDPTDGGIPTDCQANYAWWHQWATAFNASDYATCHGSIVGQILTFDFAGAAGNEATYTSNFNDTRLNSSSISRGPSLAAVANTDRFNSNMWTTSTSLDLNRYVEFTITPLPGKSFSITNVTIKFQRSNQGPKKFALRTSNDGFATNAGATVTIADDIVTHTLSFNFSIVDHETPLTIRLYGYTAEYFTGGQGGPGDSAGNDIIVNGSTQDIFPQALHLEMADASYEAFVVSGLCDAVTQYKATNDPIYTDPGNMTCTDPLPPPAQITEVLDPIDTMPYYNAIDTTDVCVSAYMSYLHAVDTWQDLAIAQNLDPTEVNFLSIMPFNYFTAYGLCGCVPSYVSLLQNSIDGTGMINVDYLDLNPLYVSIYRFCVPHTPCGVPVISIPPVIADPDTIDLCTQGLLTNAALTINSIWQEEQATLTQDFAAEYNSQCAQALEHLSSAYTNKEQHYTLYYYDQAGDLVRTVPPEGVDPLRIGEVGTTPVVDTVALIAADRLNGTRNVFTRHRMSSDYTFNSLGAPVRSKVLDQDAMNIWDTALPSGLPTKLAITSSQFFPGGKGFLTGNTVSAAAPKRGYVFHTEDAGATWTRNFDLVAAHLRNLQFQSTTIGYAAGDNGTLLKTLDSGSSWDMVQTGISPTADLLDVHFISSSSGVLVGRAGGSALLSGTTGTSFNTISLGALSSANSVTGWGTNNYLVVGTTADSLNGNVVVGNGSSWSILSATQAGSTAANLTCAAPLDTSVYVAGGYGVLLYSSNTNGTTIPFRTIATHTTLDFKKIWFLDAQNGIAIMDSIAGSSHYNVLRYTNDGGVHWTPFGTYTDHINAMYAYSAQPDVQGKLIAVGNSGRVLQLVMNAGMAPGIIPQPSLGTDAFLSVWALQDVGTGALRFMAGTSAGEVRTAVDLLSVPPIYGNTYQAFVSPVSGVVDIVAELVGSSLHTAMHSAGNKARSSAFAITTHTWSGGVAPSTSTYSAMSYRSISHHVLLYNTATSKLEKFPLNTFASPAPFGATHAFTPKVMVTTGTSQQIMVLAADQGGLLSAGLKSVTDPTSAAWTDRTQHVRPLPLYDLQDGLTDGSALACGAQGTFFVRATTSAPWQAVPTRTVQDLHGVTRVGSDVIAVGDAGTVIKGQTSNPASFVPLNVPSVFDLNDVANNGNALTIAGDAGKLLYTANYTANVLPGGSAMELLSINGGDLSGVARRSTSAEVFAVGAHAIVLRTVGDARVVIHDVFPSLLNDVHFIANGSEGYVVGNGLLARHTVDGGLTWEVVPVSSSLSPLPDLKTVWTGSPGTAYAGGTQSSWLQFSGNTAANLPGTLPTGITVNDICIAASGAGLMVADNGSYATKLPGVGWTIGTTVGLPLRKIWNWPAYLGTDEFLALTSDSHVFSWKYQGSSFAAPVGSTISGGIINPTAIWFHDRVTGLLATAGGHLYHLTGVLEHNTPFVATPVSQFPDALNGQTTPGSIDIATIGFVDRDHGFLGGSYHVEDCYARIVSDATGLYSQRFWYDRVGRLAASQNTKQFNMGRMRYSYSRYDALGRPVQAGEVESEDPVFASAVGTFVNGLYNPSLVDDAHFADFLDHNYKYDVISTFYDAPIPSSTYTFAQDNLRLRVASVTRQKTYNSNPLTFDHATHYSYDIHGNVKTLVQDIPAMATDAAAPVERWKTIDYDYDLVSGNVNQVAYQPGQVDGMYHRYEYDLDNRITSVDVSTDDLTWRRDASYFYYPHGPLMRTELGGYNGEISQGLDYAYTLQGWLKGMNSDLLRPANDMGHDGQQGGVNAQVGRDAYGFTLFYHQKDYKAIDPGWDSNVSTQFEAIQGGDLETQSFDLFNGNIAQWTNSLQPFAGWNGNNPNEQGQALASLYHYDQLNRLVHTESTDKLDLSNDWAHGGTHNLPGKMYESDYWYDANGNIRNAMRFNESSVNYDSLTYRYQTNAGNTMRNRLYSLRDAADDNAVTDITDLPKQSPVFDNDPGHINEDNNYSYDALGNLVRDTNEHIRWIDWTPTGKARHIGRYAGYHALWMDFGYGADDQRISKTVYVDGDSTHVQDRDWYIRDAQGNVMATYRYHVPNTLSFHLAERPIYGSDRIGEDVKQKELYNVTAIDVVHLGLPAATQASELRYEIKDHLGNVAAVISGDLYATYNGSVYQYSQPKLMSAQGYEAFGSLLPKRNFTGDKYRFGFNGQEKDDEIHNAIGTNYAYKYRLYDCRIGRFFSLDPLAGKYPWNSPYSFSENDPINYPELEGLEKGVGYKERKALYGHIDPVFVESGDWSGMKSNQTVYFADHPGGTGTPASKIVLVKEGTTPFRPITINRWRTGGGFQYTKDVGTAEVNLDFNFRGNTNELKRDATSDNSFKMMADFLNSNALFKLTVSGTTPGTDPNETPATDFALKFTINGKTDNSYTLKNLVDGRAQAIITVLVKEYGVNPKQLSIGAGVYGQDGAFKAVVTDNVVKKTKDQ